MDIDYELQINPSSIASKICTFFVNLSVYYVPFSSYSRQTQKGRKSSRGAKEKDKRVCRAGRAFWSPFETARPFYLLSTSVPPTPRGPYPPSAPRRRVHSWGPGGADTPAPGGSRRMSQYDEAAMVLHVQ